jgi:hypothetical protein
MGLRMGDGECVSNVSGQPEQLKVGAEPSLGKFCTGNTVCINKTSSAELSEAINSMYQWYRRSQICYAYLEDFDGPSTYNPKLKVGFGNSRWWSRGWTLQELIAPNVVEFYDCNWKELGTKSSQCEEISKITGINIRVLQGEPPSACNVAERMTWAASRETTQLEDRAYSLMGIFGVNMPMLYDEGGRAFIRLQEEIMKVCEDYTLFAWLPRWENASSFTRGLLAESPSDFREPNYSDFLPSASGLIGQWAERTNRSIEHHPPSLTSGGLRIGLLLAQRYPSRHYLACLTSLRQLPPTLVCLSLRQVPHAPHLYERAFPDGFLYVQLDDETALRNKAYEFEYSTIYVARSSPMDWRPRWLGYSGNEPRGLVIVNMDNERHSISCWSKSYRLKLGPKSLASMVKLQRQSEERFSYGSKERYGRTIMSCLDRLIVSYGGYERRRFLREIRRKANDPLSGPEAIENLENWGFWPLVTLNQPLQHC